MYGDGVGRRDVELLLVAIDDAGERGCRMLNAGHAEDSAVAPLRARPYGVSLGMLIRRVGVVVVAYADFVGEEAEHLRRFWMQSGG